MSEDLKLLLSLVALIVAVLVAVGPAFAMMLKGRGGEDE